MNGIEGERVYLFRLKAKSGAGVFYHRLGSINMTKQINQTVDIFEVVAIDGSQWATLYFCMCFPRRSMKYPEGFFFEAMEFDRQRGESLLQASGLWKFFKGK